MGFCVFLCKMCLGLLCQEGKSLRTCRPWHHLHLTKKLKGKCVHDIKCTGSFLGTRHRASHTLVGMDGISPERNGPSTGIHSGKSCILGQEMKTQEVGFLVEY